MRKITLLMVIIAVLMAFAGCQQTGLSEAEVESIVRDEIIRQLDGAQLKTTIEQEVTVQLSNMDLLMVSRLHIVDDTGRTVASLSEFNGEGNLILYNASGKFAVIR